MKAIIKNFWTRWKGKWGKRFCFGRDRKLFFKGLFQGQEKVNCGWFQLPCVSDICFRKMVGFIIQPNVSSKSEEWHGQVQRPAILLRRTWKTLQWWSHPPTPPVWRNLLEILSQRWFGSAVGFVKQGVVQNSQEQANSCSAEVSSNRS